MNYDKKLFITKHIYLVILFMFCLICVLTGAFSFQYYIRLQNTINDESQEYLKEISTQIGNNISRAINDNYASLNSLASIIKSSDAATFSEVSPITMTQQSYWNCLDILLIEKNGNAYNSEGTSVVLNNNTYFKNSVLNRQQGIYTTQMIDNKECIMLVIPLYDVTINGKTMVALAATYTPDTFEKILSMSAFNRQAFSCIISKEGTVVLRTSTSQAILKLGYNVLTTIENAQPDSVEAIDLMKKDITASRAGQIEFTQDNTRYYGVYTPVHGEDWFLMTFVPTKVVNAKSDMMLRTTLLLCSLVASVFSGLLAFMFYIFYRNKHELEKIAYVDEVTGGHTIQKFYLLARAALHVPDHLDYALVYTNFEKFKVLNEQLGRIACDNMLKTFVNTVEGGLTDNECLGRLSADNFCILLRYEDEAALLSRFLSWYSAAEAYIIDYKPVWSLPTTEYGIYIIEDNSIPFPQMIDRAKLALKESARSINNKLHFAIYNDQVRQQLFREKHLEDIMEQALRDGEFQVYLQPKYRLPGEVVDGAEALTRWANKAEGMIYPDEFIPLFEKNGFIIQLDLWVFEEVCRNLRRWLDDGIKPVKISVNCSRAHLKNPDFLLKYRKLADEYQIPEGLLEIELTESLVMRDSVYLSQVIDQIHALGFGCSMDDFGSGYSSLNLIQSIRVDTLKLDRIFFQNKTKDSARMKSVVENIISMAKALSMETVAEGVEDSDHVAMLKAIGCDYIQGYVFAKPMPISNFEELAFGGHEHEKN